MESALCPTQVACFTNTHAGERFLLALAKCGGRTVTSGDSDLVAKCYSCRTRQGQVLYLQRVVMAVTRWSCWSRCLGPAQTSNPYMAES